MNGLSKFWIDIINLKNQEFHFEYKINDSFFSHFEESEIKKGSLDCLVVLRKTENFLETTFQINGVVELECDRSLDKFNYPVGLSRKIIFKYGEEDKEIDDEVEMISRNRQRINMAQYINEFIATGIPMKKLHPRYGQEESGKEEELIYTSSSGEPGLENHGEEIDPRWEALKKLRKK